MWKNGLDLTSIILSENKMRDEIETKYYLITFKRKHPRKVTYCLYKYTVKWNTVTNINVSQYTRIFIKEDSH